MKLTFILFHLFLALTLCQSVNAQKNFEPGYVVIANKDTLKGSIAYLNWSKNPEKINFKTNSNGPEKVYGLADLSSFNVHGENYVKAIVDIDDTPFKTGELSNSPIPKSHADTVFLRVLASGPKSLFFLRGEEAKEHFYIKTGDTYQWLTSYRYEFRNDEKSGVVVIDTYKQQLKEYLSDCPEFAGKTSFLNYSQASIGKLFETYYQKCSSNIANKIYKSDRIKTEFGVIAGLSITKLTLKGPTAAFIMKGSFPISSQIAGGVFLNFILPRTQKKVSVYNELFFSSYKVTNHTEKYVSDQDHSFTDLSVGFSYLKLNNMARYTIPFNGASLFLNAGISNGLAVSENNYNKTVTYFYSNQGGVTESKLIKETRKYEQGILFGVGGTVKKLSFEVRCELSNGVSPYNDLKTGVRRYFALLAYRLK